MEKWNGNGDKFNLVKPDKLPLKLYHVSRRENRNSILKIGLYSSIGDEYYEWWNYEGPNGEYPDDEELPECVFLTDKPKSWSDLAFEEGEFDIYEIDLNKIDTEKLFFDPDSSMKDRGSYCYLDNIPVNAIKLSDTIYVTECTGVQGGATPANVGGMGDIVLPGGEPGSGSPGSGDIPLPSPTGKVYTQVQPFDQFIKKNLKNGKIKKSKRKRRLEKNSDAEHTPNAPVYDYVDDFRTYAQRTQNNLNG